MVICGMHAMEKEMRREIVDGTRGTDVEAVVRCVKRLNPKLGRELGLEK
jgi:hypothetical protein